MKQVLKGIGRAAALALVLILYPLVALAGAPWAFFTSIGDWGYTPWREWKERWGMFSPESLKGGWEFVTGRRG